MSIIEKSHLYTQTTAIQSWYDNSHGKSTGCRLNILGSYVVTKVTGVANILLNKGQQVATSPAHIYICSLSVNCINLCWWFAFLAFVVLQLPVHHNPSPPTGHTKVPLIHERKTISYIQIDYQTNTLPTIHTASCEWCDTILCTWQKTHHLTNTLIEQSIWPDLNTLRNYLSCNNTNLHSKLITDIT